MATMTTPDEFLEQLQAAFDAGATIEADPVAIMALTAALQLTGRYSAQTLHTETPPRTIVRDLERQKITLIHHQETPTS